MSNNNPKKPKVVVACAWYNRADYIRDTVDSLLAQDFDNFEVVIVNDGSSDPRVKEILDSYDDPRLKVVHQENTGFVGAISRAIKMSEAPYIAIQGAGDISYPQRLSSQYEIMERRRDIIGTTGSFWNLNVGGPKNGAKELRTPKKNLTTLTDILTRRLVLEHGIMMMRREAFNKVGGYRKIFRYGQDFDLFLRMSLHGSFYIANDIVYERRSFVNESVSGSVLPTITQGRLVAFARECILQRINNGYDLVDIFGDQALLFRRDDKTSAVINAKSALKFLISGEHKLARLFTKLSLNEKTTLIGVVVWLITTPPEGSFISKSLPQLLNKIKVNDRKVYKNVMANERVK